MMMSDSNIDYEVKMISSEGHIFLLSKVKDGYEAEISFAGELKEGTHSGVDMDSVTKLEKPGLPFVKTGKILNELVLDKIRELVASSRVSDKNQVTLIVNDVNSKAALDLVRYLEDHNIGVHSPSSVIFFEREEVMLLIGSLIFLFPDYRKKLEEGGFEGYGEINNDNGLFAYYERCIDFAYGAIRGVAGKPLRDFIDRHSKVHHRLYLKTDYSYTGLLYRLFEFEPFRSSLDIEGSDKRASRNIGLLVSLVSDFEYANRIRVLEPLSAESDTEKLFNVHFRDLFMGGISNLTYDPKVRLSAAPAGFVAFRGLKDHMGRTYQEDDAFDSSKQPVLCEDIEIRDFDGIEESDNNSSITSVDDNDAAGKPFYSLERDLYPYARCPLQYWFYNELGFRPDRPEIGLSGLLVRKTIADFNSLMVSGDFDAAGDTLWNMLDANLRSQSGDLHSFLDEKESEDAFKLVLKYVEVRKGIWSSIIEPDLQVRIERDSSILEGSIALTKSESGLMETMIFSNGKRSGVSDSWYRVILSILSDLALKERGEVPGRMHLYNAYEIKGDPVVSFDFEPDFLKKAFRDADSAASGILTKDFNIRTNDRDTCLTCSFRFYCRRTDMKKMKKR
jgi:DNA helicase-2/ATP-dependent DNA helicase PcrA